MIWRRQKAARGYGNIYTPNAGAMIIHVQRESGLANRTIVLSPRKVRWLRRSAVAAGIAFSIIAASWVFLAAQAARVPLLTHRLERLQHDALRIDTLQAALTELEGRYEQVQKMLGAGAPSPNASAPAAATPGSTSTSITASAATTRDTNAARAADPKPATRPTPTTAAPAANINAARAESTATASPTPPDSR